MDRALRATQRDPGRRADRAPAGPVARRADLQRTERCRHRDTGCTSCRCIRQERSVPTAPSVAATCCRRSGCRGGCGLAADCSWQRPLRAGTEVTKETAIVDIVAKQGRSGRLVFVQQRHAYLDAAGVALTEEQDVVYRDHARPDAAPTQPVDSATGSGMDAHGRNQTRSCCFVIRRSRSTHTASTTTCPTRPGWRAIPACSCTDHSSQR